MKKIIFVLGLILNIAFLMPTAAGEWLRGDLHLHTNVGNNADSTASEILQFAENQGLDFVAVTEHDCKINGVPEFWKEITANKTKTIALYGMEWTHGTTMVNNHGHMNLWSSKPFDYSKFWEANQNDDALAAITQAQQQAILYSINHPNLPGFSWDYPYPKSLPSMEVWSTASSYSRSRKTLENEWTAYYEQGKRVTGVGGSDTHKFKKDDPLYTMGTPTTWVYAEKRESASILKAIREGRVLVSFSPYAPVPLLKINDEEVGSNLAISKGEELRISIESLNNNNEKGKAEELTLYKNGKALQSWRLTSNKFKVEFIDKSNGERAWYYVLLTGETGYKGLKKVLHGDMISLSNPITINF